MIFFSIWGDICNQHYWGWSNSVECMHAWPCSQAKPWLGITLTSSQVTPCPWEARGSLLPCTRMHSAAVLLLWPSLGAHFLLSTWRETNGTLMSANNEKPDWPQLKTLLSPALCCLLVRAEPQVYKLLCDPSPLRPPLSAQSGQLRTTFASQNKSIYNCFSAQQGFQRPLLWQSFCGTGSTHCCVLSNHSSTKFCFYQQFLFLVCEDKGSLGEASGEFLWCPTLDYPCCGGWEFIASCLNITF